MNVRALISSYLNEAKLMQLSTCADNRPWTCSVWFAADEQLNIYWLSSVTRRHSKEIEKNPNVSGAIVLSHSPDDLPRGVQFEGYVSKLESIDEITKARSFYEDRIFSKEKIDQLMQNPVRPHIFYKVSKPRFVLFDTVNFPDNPQQEYIAS